LTVDTELYMSIYTIKLDIRERWGVSWTLMFLLQGKWSLYQLEIR